MSRWQDAYPADYAGQVQRALFGLPHDFFIRSKARWLRRFLAKRRLQPTTMLDIGCGTGLLHRYLGPWAGSVTGCDISDVALAEAAQHNADVAYRLQRDRALPAADEEFDLTMAVTVMHHVVPEQWPGFTTEAVRVLRPGGLFVVNEHNPWNPLTRLSVARSPIDFDAVLLSARKTMRLMRDAGLRNVGCDSIFFTPIDATLRWLPLGFQYCCYGTK